MSTITISTIQTNLAWEDKATNLANLERKIREIGQPTEIVVLPEMFSTGFSMDPERLAEPMDGETVQWMRRVAMEQRIILTGSIIIREKDQYFNRLIWMLPNGKEGIYDKRHRFAFAGEDEHYTAGNKRLIASVKGWKVNLLVCYDLRFPVWARQQSQNNGPEYDLLIYVANWPDKRSLAWRSLLLARAIENQCYVVGVNRVGDDANQIHYSGESMIIDPLGEILYCTKDIEETKTITLDKKQLDEVRERFPFWKDADGFQLLHGE